MGRRQWSWILVGWGLTLGAHVARGDYRVDQEVSLSTLKADDRRVLKYEWLIGARDMLVRVTEGDMETTIFSNGDELYLCGRLSPDQIDLLTKSVKDPRKGLDRVSHGFCMFAPKDFVLRFFMSPYEAMLYPVISDLKEPNLVISSPEPALEGTADTILGFKCVNMSRKYSLSEKISGYESDLDEKMCHFPGAKWRGMLGHRLVSGVRTSQEYKGNLKADIMAHGGIALAATIQLGLGVQIKVRTTRIEEGAIPNSSMRAPQDYKSVTNFDDLPPAVIPEGAAGSAGVAPVTTSHWLAWALMGGKTQTIRRNAKPSAP